MFYPPLLNNYSKYNLLIDALVLCTNNELPSFSMLLKRSFD